MAKFVGNVAKASIGGSLVTQNDVTNISYSYTLDNAESTGMGDSAKTRLRVIKDLSFTVNGYNDDTGTATALGLRAVAKASLDDADGSIAVILYPAGNAAGKQTLSFSAVLDSYDTEAPMSGVETISLKFSAAGAVLEGVV